MIVNITISEISKSVNLLPLIKFSIANNVHLRLIGQGIGKPITINLVSESY